MILRGMRNFPTVGMKDISFPKALMFSVVSYASFLSFFYILVRNQTRGPLDLGPFPIFLISAGIGFTLMSASAIAFCFALDGQRRKRMGKYFLGSLFLFFALPTIATIHFFVSSYHGGPDAKTQFESHRMFLESIVNQVRSDNFKGRRTEVFTEDGAATLPNGSPEPGTTTWDRRARNGTLQVVILMAGDGKTGGYGFAYSDRPLQPTPGNEADGPGGFISLDVPGPMHTALPIDNIDDHWWRVLANRKSQSAGDHPVQVGERDYGMMQPEGAMVLRYMAIGGAALGLLMIACSRTIALFTVSRYTQGIGGQFMAMNPLISEKKKLDMTDPDKARRSIRIVGIVFLIQAGVLLILAKFV
jgi:hypothetical protein